MLPSFNLCCLVPFPHEIGRSHTSFCLIPGRHCSQLALCWFLDIRATLSAHPGRAVFVQSLFATSNPSTPLLKGDGLQWPSGKCLPSPSNCEIINHYWMEYFSLIVCLYGRAIETEGFLFVSRRFSHTQKEYIYARWSL